MFSKIFKSKKNEASKSNVEKLNKNELKNVIGGGSGDVTPVPDPNDVKKHITNVKYGS